MIIFKKNIIKKNKKEIIIFIIIITIILIISIFLTKLLVNKTSLELIINKYKTYSFAIIIFLQIIQMIFAFIPSGIINIVGGAMLGTFWGTITSLIGVILGSLIIFYISKIFGRKFLEKIINKKQIEFIDNIKEEKLELTLFILYLIPFLPKDIFTYLAGITKIKTKDFLIVSTFGRLPVILFTSYYGSQLIKENIDITIYLTIIIIILSVLIYIFRENIMKLIHTHHKKTK